MSNLETLITQINGMEFVDMIKKGDPNSGAVPNPDKIISIKAK